MNHNFRAFLLLLVGCVFITACRPEPRATVLYMGDSLMDTAIQEIYNGGKLQEGSTLFVFNAILGSGIYNTDGYWIPRLASIQSRMTLDMVFISLGTNDSKISPDAFPGAAGIAEQITELLNSFPATTTVYWIVPHNSIKSADGIYPVTFNTVVKEIYRAKDSGQWPNLKLLSFDQWAASQKDKMADYLQRDGIHFNKTGKKAWANMIQSSIDAEYPVIQ